MPTSPAPLSWDDAQNSEAAYVAQPKGPNDDYSLDDVAKPAAAPATRLAPGDDYALEDAGAPAAAPADQPTKLSTPAYIAGRALDAPLNIGDMLRHDEVATNPFVTDADVAADAARPSSAAYANNKVFGTPELGTPRNAWQRYGGDLAETAAGNPIGAAIAPATTALSSLGGTAAGDLGVAPIVGKLAAPLLALLARGAYPFAATTLRQVVNPLKAGGINAGRVLAGVDNSGAPLPQPSAADVDAATTSVRSANAGMTADAAPPFQAGQQIQNDLVARQTALKQARTDATQPLAQARDASTAKVDTDPVINVIADRLRTAAGSQAAALNGALDDLQLPSGAMRTQADQLAGARNSINVRISTAKSAGDNATVKHLSDVRDALDTQVNAAVPEAGQFTSAYQAASKPLDVFTAGKSPVDAVPNVVARDNFGNLNGTPPSEIPDSFLRGSATREKLNQLVEAYGGDKGAAESALEQHLAGVAQKAVRPDGTLDSDAFARVMQPYQKVLGAERTPAPTATPAPAPATVPAQGMAPPAQSALPTRWNAGNAGVWFPGLKAKFATAQAAQNTLDTISTQRNLATGISGGALRDDSGVVTAKSMGDWLKTNKDAIAKTQSPGAVTRLQQIAGALRRAKSSSGDVLADMAATGAGMATGGTEGAILGHMALPNMIRGGMNFVLRRQAVNNAFSSAMEQAVLDPERAKAFVSSLPRIGPLTPQSLAVALGKMGAGDAATLSATRNGPRTANGR